MTLSEPEGGGMPNPNVAVAIVGMSEGFGVERYFVQFDRQRRRLHAWSPSPGARLFYPAVTWDASSDDVLVWRKALTGLP